MKIENCYRTQMSHFREWTPSLLSSSLQRSYVAGIYQLASWRWWMIMMVMMMMAMITVRLSCVDVAGIYVYIFLCHEAILFYLYFLLLLVELFLAKRKLFQFWSANIVLKILGRAFAYYIFFLLPHTNLVQRTWENINGGTEDGYPRQIKILDIIIVWQ